MITGTKSLRVVTLIKPDAPPSSMTEKGLCEYLTSSSIGFRFNEIVALNDVPEYGQAIGLDFEKAGGSVVSQVGGDGGGGANGGMRRRAACTLLWSHIDHSALR